MNDAENAQKTAKKGIRLAAVNKVAAKEVESIRNPYEPYQPLKGVLPKGTVAQDAVLDNSTSAYAYGAYQGASFVGYPYLAQLSTITEYRNPSDIIASEMTRKWVTLNSSGEGDFSEQIKAINDELERFKIRHLFYQAALMDGLFGISFISISMKSENLKLPLVISDKTIQKNSIKAFSLVEPIWCSPLRYNAISPLKPDFYKPTAWAVMGTEVHASRLLKFISRPMPDILKPAFNFGGMSLTQLLMPFVNSWISTRDSIGDLIRIFSITTLKTDMSQVLSGGDGNDIVNRAKLFNQTRDSRGLMMLNADTEDLMQVNTPLSGLGDLQAQSAEQMAFPAQIPLVKLFGISPRGLNASSAGEIKVFYDHIHEMQEKLFRQNLTHVLQLVQLNLFGKIIEEIGFAFEHLDDVAPDTQASINKTRADTDNVYVQMGVISQEEVRANLANDVTSGYENLDEDDMPEPPEGEAPKGEPPKKPSAAKVAKDEIGLDKAHTNETGMSLWHETDHPRDDDGKFGTGAGAGKNNRGEILLQKTFSHSPVEFPTDYKEVPNKTIGIPFDQLIPTQKSVDPEGVGNYIAGKGNFQDSPIEVVKKGDNYLIIDGHHRAASKIINGIKNDRHFLTAKLIGIIE